MDSPSNYFRQNQNKYMTDDKTVDTKNNSKTSEETKNYLIQQEKLRYQDYRHHHVGSIFGGNLADRLSEKLKHEKTERYPYNRSSKDYDNNLNNKALKNTDDDNYFVKKRKKMDLRVLTLKKRQITFIFDTLQKFLKKFRQILTEIDGSYTNWDSAFDASKFRKNPNNNTGSGGNRPDFTVLNYSKYENRELKSGRRDNETSISIENEMRVGINAPFIDVPSAGKL
ncbi:hypothetical protein F8M41_008646 [Gigaspora margarita]|uniref:Uncharacterized protein n=1 Tax=Gigaspora margarita TaxID=4874 RepID=A0A8H4EQZ8_GIGMA|nr:hypothetical protein F8M41_008646 [Gigaspora margarita]